MLPLLRNVLPSVFWLPARGSFKASIILFVLFFDVWFFQPSQSHCRPFQVLQDDPFKVFSKVVHSASVGTWYQSIQALAELSQVYNFHHILFIPYVEFQAFSFAVLKFSEFEQDCQLVQV